MIYTSGFFSPKIRNRQNCYSIALSQPRSCNYPTIKEFQPTWDLLRHWKRAASIPYYREVYFNILSKYDAYETGKELQEATLLCWETAGHFCHRQLVAEWLREAGWEVKEL